ncbi:hypothetical protein A6A04_09065 [Paramagnetospirillum marisnigri]|uniref:DUF218 domain-containing protein n=1 Tax=Paramagnetospirillum marisnigri TaxID=1285242 RepID=A0A178M5J5_9PROT|nr:YdcF family protein [Paramagnetospirillum marisnigri]OAN44021.1 hypothetical protein A6A04_09065 [Paramagnetospirillum marisnigri]
MFILSKVLGALTDPSTLFLLAVILGCLLLLSRRLRAWGRRVLVVSVLAALLVAVVPVERLALTWLENRFPIPAALPDHVDGIIVLGGGINPLVSARRGQPTVNSAITRLTAMLPLARNYPEARVIFSGGSGMMLEQSFKEAHYAKEFIEQIGQDPSRFLYEDQSRNTHENALFSHAMAKPKLGETWLLVTSAFHMPRAVGSFRAIGWPVLPYPVDFHTTGEVPTLSDLRFNLAAASSGLGLVLHELTGLAAYRVFGWSDALFPHP